MSDSPAFQFDGGDPEMQRAYENARANFRYFWREVAWDRRRIIPIIDVACVKAPFSDGDRGKRSRGKPNVEHMWLTDIEFDGRVVTGVLMNSPNHLKSVEEGDSAEFPLDQISDWMYAISEEVYGAYTVNLMRARMGKRERKQHDAAWGLKFGDPDAIRVVPGPPAAEHPMSVSMAKSLKEQLAEDPSLATSADDRGWTELHHEALAGNLATAKVLLEAGADPAAVTDRGMTPLQLARSLGWKKVVALLTGE